MARAPDCLASHACVPGLNPAVPELGFQRLFLPSQCDYAPDTEFEIRSKAELGHAGLPQYRIVTSEQRRKIHNIGTSFGW